MKSEKATVYKKGNGPILKTSDIIYGKAVTVAHVVWFCVQIHTNV